MKRLHVNLSVDDLDRSVDFYTRIFGSEPSVIKDDYAKWMLDDPRVNFALSTHGDGSGFDHLGIEAEDDTEFADMRARLNAADTPVLDQPDVTCCYARSTKAWVRDPNGVPWETFISKGTSAQYGDGSTESAARVTTGTRPAAACCGI